MATGVNPETGKIEYVKKCVHCKKEFYSSSRGTRYCSQLCCDRHQKKVAHQRKVYNRDKDYTRLINKSYAVAREVANMFLPKPKGWDETWEVHHKDCNPFNNDIANLVWVAHEDHEKIHAILPRVNMVTVMKIWEGVPTLFDNNTETYVNMVIEDKLNTVDPKLTNLLSRYQVKEV